MTQRHFGFINANAFDTSSPMRPNILVLLSPIIIYLLNSTRNSTTYITISDRNPILLRTKDDIEIIIPGSTNTVPAQHTT